METRLEIRRAVESEIRIAFRGVILGRGMSLRQAQLAGRPKGEIWNPNCASSAPEEVADWSKVPLDELDRDCIAHLDADGFRYYIPALMLSVLDNYDPASMRVIGTLSGLYPKDDHREYAMHRYSLLNHPQKAAIARFLAALPGLVDLDFEGQKIVPRALRNYWSEYLQSNPPQ